MNAYNLQAKGIVMYCVKLEHSALFNCRDRTVQMHTSKFLYDFNANIWPNNFKNTNLMNEFCFDHQQDSM